MFSRPLERLEGRTRPSPRALRTPPLSSRTFFAAARVSETMGKIQRSVMPKGGRRGSTGLKGKIHRSVSRVPVKKTIVRDRSRDYHGVDKLERQVRALEEEEAGGWQGLSKLAVKAKQKDLKNARAKLMIKDVKHDR